MSDLIGDASGDAQDGAKVRPTSSSLQNLPASRSLAQAVGSPFYFTGKPCTNGHLAKRYTNTGSCQICIQDRNHAARAANPERTREWDKSRRMRQPGTDRRKRVRGTEKNRSPYYRLLWLTRSRARRTGIACDLTDDDIKKLVERADGRCELTGIAFDQTPAGEGYRRPYSPSLDRIDNTQGYTFSNVRLICSAMNLALGDFGEGVFARLAEGYLRKKGTA